MWTPLVFLALGCQVDPLSAAGLDPAAGGAAPADPADPAVAAAPVEPAPPAPAGLEIPTTPPMSSGTLDPSGGAGQPADPAAAGGGASGEPTAAAEPAPAPVPYDPVSRPQGAREGGARFEGVGKRKTSRGLTTEDAPNGSR